MSHYVDTAVGGVHNRNKCMPIEEFQKDIFIGKEDCYATYFIFGEDFKDHILKTGSVKEFKGIYTAHYLPFDIDFDDLNKAKEMTMNLIQRLRFNYEINDNDMDIYFSGAKGFHVQLSAELFGGFETRNDWATIFKEIAIELSAGIEIDTSIYEQMRLWRLPNTINTKTGLFKIPLYTPEVFDLSIEEIKNMATQPRNSVTSPKMRNEALAYVLKTACEYQQPKKENIIRKPVFPKNEKYCIYNMLNNGVPEGERNNAILRLAVYFKDKFNPEMVFSLLNQWKNDKEINLPDNEIRRTIESSLNGYDFGCNDGLLVKYCNNMCSYYRKKKDVSSFIKTIDDLETEYIQYIKDIDKVKIDLSKWLPKFSMITRGLVAGEVVMVIAGSGVGKTAMLQNILWETKYPAIFFSYELPEILTYERFYQIANDCSGESVENDYIKNSIKSNIMKVGLRNLLFTFTPDIEINDIPAIVELVEKQKEKLRIVAIDYLGLVKGGFGSRYERVSYVAEKLKDIAKKTNTVVFCLAQTSRQQGAKGDEELNITSGKDSGSIENTGDIVLGLWRPDKKNDTIMRIEILKNRKGKDRCHIDCVFHKESLRIKEWTKQEDKLPIESVQDTETQSIIDDFGGEVRG